MTEPIFFTEFLIVLVLATFTALAFDRFRLPAVLGFLLTGVAIGPHGLAILSSVDRIHVFAEIGVVLLMLTIGLEFSIQHLKGLWRIAVVGGSMQIVVSVTISFLFAMWRDWTVFQGVFLGSVIALSSTAMVLKYLIDRGEIDTQHGRASVAILLFQDFAIVPLLIMVQGYGDGTDFLGRSILWSFLKAGGLLAVVLVFARHVLPHFLGQVAKSRSQEIFFLCGVVVCLGMAWASGRLGLSFAIGAFLAGFMFANTDYGYQLSGDIIPFRHVFVSLFFVSIGMLFDVHFMAGNLFIVMMLVGLVLLVNTVVMTLLMIALGAAPRVALVTGIMLAQIGEFSFLLLEAARINQVIEPHFYQLLLSVAFVTMLLTPLLFSLVPWIIRLMSETPAFGSPQEATSDLSRPVNLREHIILCGYGPSGQDLADAFSREKMPFVLLELNPKRIEAAKKKGLRVIYGDAANRAILARAGIQTAKMLVVSFADQTGMMQIIRTVQHLNHRVSIAVRTRFEREIPGLYELGADIVVMEEWEANHELNRLVLQKCGVRQEDILDHLERIRLKKELVIEQAILHKGSL